jgi:DMSO reductase anchor subunit
MILFTTIAGAAQGLLLLLVVLDIVRTVGATDPGRDFFVAGAVTVVTLACAGLAAATFHLGRPLRAWRAVTMWRTSWLSREVIVLPLFIGVVALWGLGHGLGQPQPLLGVAGAVLALALFLCTGMIYAAVKAIRAWATPMTPLNFALIGCASGALLGTALAAALAPALVPELVLPAAVLTLAAAALRGATLWRNLRGPEKTTLQTALGVRHPRIRQVSQGAMGGSFGTREFFHGKSGATLQRVRWAAALAGFALPLAVLAALVAAPASAAALGALWLVQFAGLLAERWSFFAEGQHTQNLYHRAVG